MEALRFVVTFLLFINDVCGKHLQVICLIVSSLLVAKQYYRSRMVLVKLTFLIIYWIWSTKYVCIESKKKLFTNRDGKDFLCYEKYEYFIIAVKKKMYGIGCIHCFEYQNSLTFDNWNKIANISSKFVLRNSTCCVQLKFSFLSVMITIS
jgi:type IV secretory pathway VirB4 component